LPYYFPITSLLLPYCFPIASLLLPYCFPIASLLVATSFVICHSSFVLRHSNGVTGMEYNL
ncbi:MAG: hypothetical protein WCK09_08305, partial [Bacteroidota bacterium]